MIKDQKTTYLYLPKNDELAIGMQLLLLLDQENVTDVVVTGSCEMKEFELLMLNHGKDKR